MPTIDLKQLAGWLAGTDIALLELRSPDGRVCLRYAEAAGVSDTPLPTARPVQPTAAPPVPVAALAVKAASVGVFLDRHPLRDAPFVKAGEVVAAGRLLGLLQVGALLLPVNAPCAGIVGALDMLPGSRVGYGTALLSILPHAAA